MGKNVKSAAKACVMAWGFWLGEKARELLDVCEREKPKHKLRTFEQREQLWETVVRPALSQFRSVQELQQRQQPPAEGSEWRVNWQVPARS
jgi:hypothetical protein